VLRSDEAFAFADGVSDFGRPVPWPVFVPEPAGIVGEGQVGADDAQCVRRLQRCRGGGGDGVGRPTAQEGEVTGQSGAVGGEVPGVRARSVWFLQRGEADEACGAELVEDAGDELAGAVGPEHLPQLDGGGHAVQGERGQDLQAQGFSRAGCRFYGRNSGKGIGHRDSQPSGPDHDPDHAALTKVTAQQRPRGRGHGWGHRLRAAGDRGAIKKMGVALLQGGTNGARACPRLFITRLPMHS